MIVRYRGRNRQVVPVYPHKVMTGRSILTFFARHCL